MINHPAESVKDKGRKTNPIYICEMTIGCVAKGKRKDSYRKHRGKHPSP